MLKFFFFLYPILGREYFLLGHEDVTRQRLLYTTLSVGLEWRKKYALLIGVWLIKQSHKFSF